MIFCMDLNSMNDVELWKEIIKAEKKVNKLITEYRQRGLDRKPLYQWSRRPPDKKE